MRVGVVLCHTVWYINGMKTTIDKAGRVVIPAPIRRRAGLRPGVEIEVEFDEAGDVRLARKVPGPKLVRVGKRLIARPTVPYSQIPPIDMAALIREERERWPSWVPPPFSTPAP